MKVTKEKEKRIYHILTLFGKHCKQCLDGGKLFKEELKNSVPMVWNSILEVLNGESKNEH